MTARTELLTVCYWRNARTATADVSREDERNALASLWSLATGPSVPDRLKDAALRHLSVAQERGRDHFRRNSPVTEYPSF